MHLRLDVEGTAMNTLKMAIGLAFEDDEEPHSSRRATTAPYYRIGYEGELILFKDLPPEGAMPFPYPLNWIPAAEMAIQWLAHARYPEPNYIGDGDLIKGFKIVNNINDWREICTVFPKWIVVGK